MKELLKSKNRHILSDQKVTRISIDACSTTVLPYQRKINKICMFYFFQENLPTQTTIHAAEPRASKQRKNEIPSEVRLD